MENYLKYINNEHEKENKGNVKDIMYKNMMFEKSDSTLTTSVNSSSCYEKSSFKSPNQVNKISKISKYMSKSFGNQNATNRKLNNLHDEFKKNDNKQFSSFCKENKSKNHNAFLNYQDKTNSPCKEQIIKDDKDTSKNDSKKTANKKNINFNYNNNNFNSKIQYVDSSAEPSDYNENEKYNAESVSYKNDITPQTNKQNNQKESFNNKNLNIDVNKFAFNNFYENKKIYEEEGKNKYINNDTIIKNNYFNNNNNFQNYAKQMDNKNLQAELISSSTDSSNSSDQSDQSEEEYDHEYIKQNLNNNKNNKSPLLNDKNESIKINKNEFVDHEFINNYNNKFESYMANDDETLFTSLGVMDDDEFLKNINKKIYVTFNYVIPKGLYFHSKKDKEMNKKDIESMISLKKHNSTGLPPLKKRIFSNLESISSQNNLKYKIKKDLVINEIKIKCSPGDNLQQAVKIALKKINVNLNNNQIIVNFSENTDKYSLRRSKKSGLPDFDYPSNFY
jgi:hypothetical protein